jgi:hypothetical protein
LNSVWNLRLDFPKHTSSRCLSLDSAPNELGGSEARRKTGGERLILGNHSKNCGETHLVIYRFFHIHSFNYLACRAHHSITSGGLRLYSGGAEQMLLKCFFMEYLSRAPHSCYSTPWTSIFSEINPCELWPDSLLVESCNRFFIEYLPARWAGLISVSNFDQSSSLFNRSMRIWSINRPGNLTPPGLLVDATNVTYRSFKRDHGIIAASIIRTRHLVRTA